MPLCRSAHSFSQFEGRKVDALYFQAAKSGQKTAQLDPITRRKQKGPGNT
jgi:hypothetical protein